MIGVRCPQIIIKKIGKMHARAKDAWEVLFQ
jgi:hypothetical protein